MAKRLIEGISLTTDTLYLSTILERIREGVYEEMPVAARVRLCKLSRRWLKLIYEIREISGCLSLPANGKKGGEK